MIIDSPLDLTIAIPVKNEQTNLPGCLNAIGINLAKKIVLIDSGSTDKTREIAKSHGVEVIKQDDREMGLDPLSLKRSCEFYWPVFPSGIKLLD